MSGFRMAHIWPCGDADCPQENCRKAFPVGVEQKIQHKLMDENHDLKAKLAAQALELTECQRQALEFQEQAKKAGDRVDAQALELEQAKKALDSAVADGYRQKAVELEGTADQAWRGYVESTVARAEKAETELAAMKADHGCEFCDEGAECCQPFDDSYGGKGLPFIEVCTRCWNMSKLELSTLKELYSDYDDVSKANGKLAKELDEQRQEWAREFDAIRTEARRVAQNLFNCWQDTKVSLSQAREREAALQVGIVDASEDLEEGKEASALARLHSLISAPRVEPAKEKP